MTDLISFDPHIIDETDHLHQMGTSDFRDAVSRLLADIQWRVSRESARPPGSSPIINKDGKTIEVKRNIIFNGFSNRAAVPMTDYLTHDFSIATQLEKIHDISERFISACVAGRTDERDWLIWGAAPYVVFSRRLTPKGVMLLLTAQVDWV